MNPKHGKLQWSRAKVAMVLTGCLTMVPLPFRLLALLSETVAPDEWMQYASPNASISLSHPFQLKLPFYIYDDPNLDWSNFTPREPCRAEGPDLYEKTKHSDDFWLLKNAKEHPMRTLDPSQAKLFFVPTLLNAWASCTGKFSRGNSFCVNGVCDHKLLERAEIALRDSPWFQRHRGRDHIVVDSDWEHDFLWGGKKQPARQSAALIHCNIINWELKFPPAWDTIHGSNGSDPRFHIPAFYIGTPCPGPIQTNKTHDLAMVASFKPKLLKFAARRKVCKWLKNSKYSVAACGEGPQCPAVASARYGLHIRGDTFGSQRVMDIFLNEGIPLFTTPSQYPILPDFVPWKNMSYLIDISSKDALFQSLDSLLSLPPSDYQDKLDLMHKYRHILDHNKPFQIDAFLHRFAQLLGLYERHDSQ